MLLVIYWLIGSNDICLHPPAQFFLSASSNSECTHRALKCFPKYNPVLNLKVFIYTCVCLCVKHSSMNIFLRDTALDQSPILSV